MLKLKDDFVTLLRQMPEHWFASSVRGVRVMSPLSYALKQTFSIRYGYVFDEDRERDAVLLGIYFDEKKKYEQSLKTEVVDVK